MNPVEVRLTLLRTGYVPVPAKGKAPHIIGWQTKTATNAAEIAVQARQFADHTNTGILTKSTPAVDIDITFLPAAEAVEALAREEFEERGHMMVRIGQAPKRAFLLRTDEPFDKLTAAFTAPDGGNHKIEILGDGQQVIVDGIHPDTGKAYSWHGGTPLSVPRDDLPYVRREEMAAFVAKASELLVEQFGFQPVGGGVKANGADYSAGGGQYERADWARLTGNIIAGRDLHESLNRLGASYRHVMGEEAAIRALQALMLASTVPHDERWKARFDDIPRSVRSAEQKHGGGDGEAAEQGPGPEPEPPQPEWPTLDAAALHGLAGDVVRAIEPHSEADPVAVLVQFIAAFGSAVGNGPFFQVESDRHRGNLFAVLCGESSKARKGTSLGRVLHVMTHADRAWVETRVLSGMSSGEGLIQEVRDERKEYDKKDRAEVIVDAGVADKRLLVTEPEFARTVAAASRSGNILSGVLRQAWDSGKLATLTKNSPLKATGAHISVVGHITVAELRSVLTSTDMLNGYANRFLFILVRRSKLLPFGGDLDDADVAALGYRVRHSLVRARGVGRIGWTSDAASEWRMAYEELSKSMPGLAGAATARGEAQCVRLATLYALLDDVSLIDVPHLQAAVALWRYAEASAKHVFGGVLGDPVDEILAALVMAGDGGMSRTDIRDLFSHNAPPGRINAALALLQQTGKARREERRGTRGRPTEMWVAC